MPFIVFWCGGGGVEGGGCGLTLVTSKWLTTSRASQGVGWRGVEGGGLTLLVGLASVCL